MIGVLRELYAYRELMWNITLREFKVRYKQSFLGATWAIMQPLSLTLVFMFVSYIRPLPSDGKPYLLFSYGAMMQWTLFANSLRLSIPSLVGNANLIKKIYFPREVLPLGTIIVSVIDFCIAFVILVGLVIFYKYSGRYDVPFTPYLLLIPIILLVQLVLTLGITFFLSALNVTYRDVKHTIPLLLQLWMFASPVIYSANAVREKSELLYRFYMLNPMAPIVTSYRTVLLDGKMPDLGALGIAAAVSCVLCVSGYAYFKRVDSRFADIL
jgi:homopolymeric O-antigen transport system permease protein